MKMPPPSRLDGVLAIVALVASVVLMGVAVAQPTLPTMGGMGDPTNNFLLDLWTMAKNASPPVASFCVYLWLSERGDRRKLQAERDGLLERTINAINSSANATNNVVQLLSGNKD